MAHQTKMEKEKGGYVYIIANVHHTTFYTGVTRDLAQRMLDHRSRKYESFGKRYNCVKLLYWKWYDEIESAIREESQHKKMSRDRKQRLIFARNPQWRDLAEDFQLKPLPVVRVGLKRGGSPRSSRMLGMTNQNGDLHPRS